MRPQIRFQLWNASCLLKASLEDALHLLNQFESSNPSLEALFSAVMFVEETTGLILKAKLDRDNLGVPTYLRRLLKNDYSHNVGVEGAEYIDHWMYHGDMGSTKYSEFEKIVLAFCVPEKGDLEALAKKLGPERADHCLFDITYPKESGRKAL